MLTLTLKGFLILVGMAVIELLKILLIVIVVTFVFAILLSMQSTKV